MNESNLSILVEARTEYTKQLITILAPLIYEGIKSVHTDAKRVTESSNENTLRMFQELLRKIPKWNQDVIDDECNRIINKSKCDWLSGLITAIFIANTKVLTSVRSAENNKKIKLTVPKTAHFIHKCYVEVAREIYKNPYLFESKTNNFEKQRNMRDTLEIINSSIIEAIRKSLPFQEILKEYLCNQDDDEGSEDEELSDSEEDDFSEDNGENEDEDKPRVYKKKLSKSGVKNIKKFNKNYGKEFDNEVDVVHESRDHDESSDHDEHSDNEVDDISNNIDNNSLEVFDNKHEGDESHDDEEDGGEIDSSHNDEEVEEAEETHDASHETNNIQKNSTKVDETQETSGRAQLC